MKSSTSIGIPEILLLFALAVSILLPRALLPVGLVIAGGGYLLFLVIHSLRLHTLPKSSFGPATAALFIFIAGVCLIFLPDEPLLTLIIVLISTIIIQMIWVVLRNRLVGH